MPNENKALRYFREVKSHRNERCKEVSSKQWEQIHRVRAKPEVGSLNLNKFGCGRV